MKKNSTKRSNQTEVMRPEYDFAGGVQGKHHEAMRDGYSIRMQAADGTVSEKLVPPKSMVSLEPDVLEYFPDSQAVNHALRTLIALVPEKRKPARPKGRARSAAHGVTGKGRRRKAT